MSLLPGITELPSEPLARTHEPEVDDYTTYRDCARWDFGFTCALCFLHESDLIEGGAEGTALIWLEHIELKSEDAERRNVYANVLLSCRFCNNSRGVRASRMATGARLLDPTKDCWSQHFELRQFVLRERSEADNDAVYTRAVYDLDHARKTSLRATRNRRIDVLLRSEAAMTELVPCLMKDAAAETDPNKRRHVIEAARVIEQAYDTALEEATRYLGVPVDAPESCKCRHTRALPNWLRRQLISVIDVSRATP